MFGKLNSQEIEDLIREQIIGRIACHADEVTYIVPISYAYDGEYVYAHTFEGMKMNMMRKNPRICFQVDNTRNMANWKSVVCWGEFEELKEKQGRQNALQLLNLRSLPFRSSDTMHIGSQWPFPTDVESVPGIFFRIKLTEKTGRFEKSAEEIYYAT